MDAFGPNKNCDDESKIFSSVGDDDALSPSPTFSKNCKGNGTSATGDKTQNRQNPSVDHVNPSIAQTRQDSKPLTASVWIRHSYCDLLAHRLNYCNYIETIKSNLRVTQLGWVKWAGHSGCFHYTRASQACVRSYLFPASNIPSRTQQSGCILFPTSHPALPATVINKSVVTSLAFQADVNTAAQA